MKSLKIISLLLCLLLILPMLFACKKKGEDESVDDEPTQDLLAGMELAIPDFMYSADATLTATCNGITETVTVSYLISVSGDNFCIEFLEDEQSDYDDVMMGGSIVFCDNVLYIRRQNRWSGEDYDEKYKIDFNSFDLETVIGIFAGLLANSVPEIEGGDYDYYTSAGQSKDIAAAASDVGSAMFNSVQTLINESGIEMTVYTGLKPKMASLIDSLVKLYVAENFYSVDLAIDYDTVKIAMGGTDEKAAFSVSFDGTLTEEDYYYGVYETTTTEFNVSINAIGSVADIAPITAPADAGAYEDALPLLMGELMG